jgi:FtsP/CotA-like multicopper oxidase with cupredoxin domain
VDFSVNGRLRPKLKMQPGEVQLWRILNTSGRTAAYFMPPEGLEWRQIAQDGVQYADGPYQKSLNRPFYMAPANRVDLLVKAPLNPTVTSVDVRIQNVMARSMVRPAPTQPGEGMPGTVLLTVDIDINGPAVKKDGRAAQMPFLATAPKSPAFLQDITDRELELNNSITQTLVFNSISHEAITQALDSHEAPPLQHTINGIQFGHDQARLEILLNKTEEVPSARRISSQVIIPGYYKMRSRFVDYPGLYVMHCHILIHEDRGMMYSVEVVKARAAPVRHH